MVLAEERDITQVNYSLTLICLLLNLVNIPILLGIVRRFKEKPLLTMVTLINIVHVLMCVIQVVLVILGYTLVSQSQSIDPLS